MRNDVKLVVFDMEGTLTANPTVWEIMHQKVGTWESHGQPYWRDFRAGKMEYDVFAQMDVAAWSGSPETMLDDAVSEVPLMSGCIELLNFLNRRQIASAIISNGLERLALRLAREHSVGHVMANRERVEDGVLTGGLDLLVPYEGKAQAMTSLATKLGVELDCVMAVGDGVADAAMFRRAGVSVAFMPESNAVSQQAKHTVREPDLRLLIPLFE